MYNINFEQIYITRLTAKIFLIHLIDMSSHIAKHVCERNHYIEMEVYGE